MTTQEKNNQLCRIIKDKLNPLIDNDYILLDVPHYSNLGDTLIWQGEIDLFQSLSYRCKYSTWFGGNLDLIRKCLLPDNILLFQGGGNFGDLWPLHGEFRRKVIAMFPHHRCIILPQTIFYHSENNLREEADFFCRYPNVTICARDAKSFQLLKEWFPNNPSILVPDMAFAMDMRRYPRINNPRGTIFVKRNDKEFNSNLDYNHVVPNDAYVTDWLFLDNSKEYACQDNLTRWATRFDKRLGTDWKHKWLDLYWYYKLRTLNVRTAIDLIDHYEHIYTTRLHAAILSIILCKTDITLFDNSYGKLFSFYNTWLYDVKGMKLISE